MILIISTKTNAMNWTEQKISQLCVYAHSTQKINHIHYLNKHAQICERTYRICVVCDHFQRVWRGFFQIARPNSMKNMSRRGQKCLQCGNKVMYIRQITIFNSDKNSSHFYYRIGGAWRTRTRQPVASQSTGANSVVRCWKSINNRKNCRLRLTTSSSAGWSL